MEFNQRRTRHDYYVNRRKMFPLELALETTSRWGFGIPREHAVQVAGISPPEQISNKLDT